MNDHKRIEPVGKDPYENIKIRSVSEKPKDEESSQQPKEVNKKLFKYLTLLLLFKKFFKIFSVTKTQSFENTPIFREIETLKISLQALENNDLSQESTFLNYFALTWIRLIKDFEYYPLKDKDIKAIIKKFIDEVNQYNQGKDYSLGYYLSEFAGYKWIPFPYMEMLKNLYLEYQKKQDSSQLKKWIIELDNILKTS